MEGNDEMTDQEINQVLAEWMGLCWHTWEEHNLFFICKKCRKEIYRYPKQNDNPDFFASPADWFRLWDRAKESEEWGSFWQNQIDNWWVDVTGKYTSFVDVILDLIGKPFVEAWAKFLRERKVGK